MQENADRTSVYVLRMFSYVAKLRAMRFCVVAERATAHSTANLLRMRILFAFSYVIILQTTLLVRWLRGHASTET